MGTDGIAGQIRQIWAKSAVGPSDTMGDMSDVTRILNEIGQGNAKANAVLFAMVYDELRRVAASKLGKEHSGQTLQPTELVHDAYVRLVDVSEAQRWNSRGHFYAAAAEAMRRILVDRARQKRALKRGGDWERIKFDSANLGDKSPVDELLAVNELFDNLAAAYPTEAAIARLHYFAGFNISEAAGLLDVPVSSAHRYWVFARAWLIRQMREDSTAE